MFPTYPSPFTDNVSTINADFLNTYVRACIPRAVDGINGGVYITLTTVELQGTAGWKFNFSSGNGLRVAGAAGMTVEASAFLTVLAPFTVTGGNVDLNGTTIDGSGNLNTGSATISTGGGAQLTDTGSTFLKPVTFSGNDAYRVVRRENKGVLAANTTASNAKDVYLFGDPSVASVDCEVTFTANDAPIRFASTSASPTNTVVLKRSGVAFATFPPAANRAWVEAMYDGSAVRILGYGGGCTV